MLHAGEQRVGGNGGMVEIVGFGSRVFWEIPVQVIWEGSVGQSQLGAENTCNNKMSQMNWAAEGEFSKNQMQVLWEQNCYLHNNKE